jgi:hypothetical protein
MPSTAMRSGTSSKTNQPLKVANPMLLYKNGVTLAAGALEKAMISK